MSSRPIAVEIKRDIEKYEIVIGHSCLEDLGSQLTGLGLGHTAVIVTNPAIKSNHGNLLASGLRKNGFEVDFIEIPSGEASKSAETAFELIHQIADRYAGKSIFLVAFGGGVVGDLVGYVASCFKRGVPYIQVPTTFLAQIDSSIGGKVAIDLPFGKNLVGAFYHPRLVFSDVSVLATLDKRQIQAGLAEAVKYGIICDKGLFEMIESRVEDLLNLNQKLLTEVVAQCSRIKASIVSRDEKEHQGLRTILNFGHTVGHAIEAACQYEEYNHGEAIALGMRVAADLSLALGVVKLDIVERVNNALSRAGLPNQIHNISLDDILRCMRHDKKFKSGRNRFILMTGLGKVKIQENIDDGLIRSSINKFIEKGDCD
ncbi:MAG: 3-dehydroquinate synthase [Candidatus Omnitrophota bacterium]